MPKSNRDNESPQKFSPGAYALNSKSLPVPYEFEDAKDTYFRARKVALSLSGEQLIFAYAMARVEIDAGKAFMARLGYNLGFQHQRYEDDLKFYVHLQERRKAGGSLERRNPEKFKEKERAKRLYMECANGEHPEVTTTQEFCKFVLDKCDGIQESKSIQGWVKVWEKELDANEQLRPVFGSHNKYPRKKK